MRWNIQINGDDRDLLRLSRALANGPTRIRAEHGHYILESDHFEAMRDEPTVRADAERVLQQISGAFWILDDLAREFTVRVVHEEL